jgi:hypothetical protein
MDRQGTKETAELVLRELPSVVGAFVREDAHGYPREVHLLIAPGPKARHFAQDVKSLLEERLGVPIDQRIISIAQLAAVSDEAEADAPEEEAPPPSPADVVEASVPVAVLHPQATPAALPAPVPLPRVRFVTALSEVSDGRVTVRVKLEWDGREYEGSAIEFEAGSGRMRAGAMAVLRAGSTICGEHGRFELDGGSIVRVMDREYALVSTHASSPFLGRGALTLAGAHPLDDDAATAGALAALKSTNRLLGYIAKLGEAEASGALRVARR